MNGASQHDFDLRRGEPIDNLSDVLDCFGSGLVVLVGSGISRVPPSCLPTGGELAKAIIGGFDELARPVLGDVDADRLCGVLTGGQLESSNGARTLQAGGLPLEALLERSEQIAGDSSEVEQFLQINLDTPSWNVVHSCLAHCLLDDPPLVRAVISTNYDLLVERAANAIHLGALKTVYGPAQREQWSKGEPVQFKIHGSLDDMPSVVRTLSGERRLDSWKRDFLVHLVDGCTLLVVGYSGRDFDVCPALEMTKPASLLWNVHTPRSTVSAGAMRLIEKLGGRFVCGDASLLEKLIAASASQRQAVLRPPAATLLTESSADNVDLSMFSGHGLWLWLCQSAVAAGAGQFALRLLDGATNYLPSHLRSILHQTRAQAHFLCGPSGTPLRGSVDEYRLAIRAATRIIERIELLIEYLGVFRGQLIDAPLGLHVAGATDVPRLRIRLGSVVRLVGVTTRTLWLLGVAIAFHRLRKPSESEASRMARVRGCWHLCSAQGFESAYQFAKQRGWTKAAMRVLRWLALLSLDKALAVFAISDNYYNTLHAERLKAWLSEESWARRRQTAEKLADAYQQLGYLTARANALRDVAVCLLEGRSKDEGAEIAARGLLDEADVLSSLVGDAPGREKAQALIRQLSINASSDLPS